MAKAILYDATLCIGCLTCEEACATKNKLRYDDGVKAEKKTSDHKFTYVAVRKNASGGETYMRRMCMHCSDPTCVSVCPVGALQKTKAGPVVYDESRCMGCRYCMIACPYGIPKYEWSKALPGVRKCIMCPDRVQAGLQTACAEACPTGATIFGDRESLLAEAKKRIAAEPGKYITRIYGESEYGGSSVLLLASAPFEQYGFPASATAQPLPALTANMLEKVPGVVTVGWAALGGIWWITSRRRRTSEKRQRPEGALVMTFPKIKITFWRVLGVIFVTAGLYSTLIRFYRGLGASTNLSDSFPWGLWIGFDCLCGIMLAAGGFTLMATVYVFNLDKFKTIARAALVTAFLGYLLEICAVLFDLGRPYRIWHPLIMWNPRSVMFLVGWCVMLYTGILALEFSPVVFERLRFEKSLRIIRAISTPIIIAGVVVAVIHQSALGSFYLIVPGKLHPLWYSPLLPLLFFVSSVAVGLGMTIFELAMSARHFNHALDKPIILALGRVMMVVLIAYGILRFEDLIQRGSFKYALAGGYEANMFWVEIALGVLIPVALLLFRAIRENPIRLYIVSMFVVGGFMVNRLNVAVTGMEQAAGHRYVPKWTEVSVTLMMVTIGIFLFTMVMKYLPIFHAEEPAREKTVRLPAGIAPVPAR